MFQFLLTVAAAQGLSPAATPDASADKLSDLPNVTVSYYDVSGNKIRTIHRSIDERAPRDSATSKAVPATSDWSIKAGVKTLTTNGQCRLTGVTLRFGGNARMPRLVALKNEPIPPELNAAWQAYVAKLEARQVAQLRFAYDRLGQVERAIQATNCASWKGAANAAIERLKQEQAAARAADVTAAPKLEISKEEREEETIHKEL